MPKDLGSELQGFLDSGRAVARSAIMLDFAEGAIGFWNGHGNETVNTITYYGAGKYLTGQDVTQVTNGSPVPIVITLSGIPGKIMTPDRIALIDNSTYKGRTIRIYRWYYNPITWARIKILQTAAGRMDVINHKRSVGGSYTITVRGESLALDQKKTLYRMRTDSDQKKFIDTADRFWQHAPGIGRRTLDWGAHRERLRTGRRNIPGR